MRVVYALYTITVLAILAAVGTLVHINTSTPAKPFAQMATPTVKVQYRFGGHGSGFHIGNGYIVTAQHVLRPDAKEPLTIRDSNKRVRPAEVLWSNTTYDIALLRVENPGDLMVARMSCDVPERGTHVRSNGYPLDTEQFGWDGIVQSGMIEVHRWKKALLTNIPLVGGASGGPVFDDRGAVVAVAVGMRTYRLGMMLAPAGMGMIVPTAVVCDLMGRG